MYLSIYLYIYIYIYVYQSVCLSICMYVCLSIHLSIYLAICLSIYLSVRLSVYLSVFLSIYLYICMSIYPSVCPSACLQRSLEAVCSMQSIATSSIHTRIQICIHLLCLCSIDYFVSSLVSLSDYFTHTHTLSVSILIGLFQIVTTQLDVLSYCSTCHNKISINCVLATPSMNRREGGGSI